MTTASKPTRETPASRRVVVTPSGAPRQFEVGGRSVTFVPLAIKRRHRSKLIVPPAGSTSVRATSSFDLPLIRTLGKAFYWQRLIDTGEVANASGLARRLKLEQGWVSEVLRMTQLAPDIIRAILEGRQPRHLNLHAMRGRQVEVPLGWDAQRVLYEFVGQAGGLPPPKAVTQASEVESRLRDEPVSAAPVERVATNRLDLSESLIRL
ncbi:MAG: hypothetical protein ACOYNZ_13195 [Rhodoferax sp.]